jgi:tetratricopeptide (TPR) repeat protein
MRILKRRHPGGRGGLVHGIPSATRLGGRPPVVWRAAFAGMTIFLFVLSGWAADAPALAEDSKIAQWINQIDRSSESGDFNAVQAIRMKMADYAAQEGRYDFAAGQYELLLAARPGRAERVRVFTKLGNMRMALQDYSRAISSFDDALHDSPKDWEANLARARAFSAIDLNQRAIESYTRCIKLRPLDAASYEELGNVYEKQGFRGKALTYYEKALVREPKPGIYLHMADCYVHLKDFAQATSVLAQAKARLPRADYDVRLGEIYQSLGDPGRASVAWEEALKAAPGRDDVRLKLTLIYDQLHRQSDADRLFKQLLAAYPQSPLVHYFKALVLWERGEKTAAKAEALIVESLSPTETVSHYNELLLSHLRKPS